MRPEEMNWLGPMTAELQQLAVQFRAVASAPDTSMPASHAAFSCAHTLCQICSMQCPTCSVVGACGDAGLAEPLVALLVRLPHRLSEPSALTALCEVSDGVAVVSASFQVLRACSLMALVPANQARLGAAGIVPPVHRILQKVDLVKHPAIAEQLFRCVANCAVDDANKVAFGEAGIIPLLVRLLGPRVTLPEAATTYLCRALVNLALDCGNRTRFAAAQVAEPVGGRLRILSQNQSPNPEVAESLCSGIANLALNSTIQSSLATSEIIGAIVRIFERTHPGANPDLAEALCRCVGNLCDGCDDCTRVLNLKNETRDVTLTVIIHFSLYADVSAHLFLRRASMLRKNRVARDFTPSTSLCMLTHLAHLFYGEPVVRCLVDLLRVPALASNAEVTESTCHCVAVLAECLQRGAPGALVSLASAKQSAVLTASGPARIGARRIQANIARPLVALFRLPGLLTDPALALRLCDALGSLLSTSASAPLRTQLVRMLICPPYIALLDSAIIRGSRELASNALFALGALLTDCPEAQAAFGKRVAPVLCALIREPVVLDNLDTPILGQMHNHRTSFQKISQKNVCCQSAEIHKGMIREPVVLDHLDTPIFGQVCSIMASLCATDNNADHRPLYGAAIPDLVTFLRSPRRDALLYEHRLLRALLEAVEVTAAGCEANQIRQLEDLLHRPDSGCGFRKPVTVTQTIDALCSLLARLKLRRAHLHLVVPIRTNLATAPPAEAPHRQPQQPPLRQRRPPRPEAAALSDQECASLRAAATLTDPEAILEAIIPALYLAAGTPTWMMEFLGIPTVMADFDLIALSSGLPALCQAFITAGIMPALIRLLLIDDLPAESTTSRPVAGTLFALLGTLLQEPGAHQAAVGSEALLNKMAREVERDAAHEMTQTPLMNIILGCIAPICDSHDVPSCFSRPSFLQALARLGRTPSFMDSFQGAAAWASVIGAMGSHPAIVEQMRSLGISEQLQSLLACPEWTAHPLMARAGCHAIAAMAPAKPDQLFIKPLVDLLKSPLSRSDALVGDALCPALFAAHPDTSAIERFLALGGLEALASLASAHQSNRTVWEAIGVLLQHLTHVHPAVSGLAARAPPLGACCADCNELVNCE
ncbi:hypothetical protein PAPYR_8760 [Paratrimastix pyriformis]|uniref:Uncharacterized protein n=1 Tax=Paratrimastix pyriformis TaxID=342808 RepID=A0ABQ8UDF8_9EUKA|nr:hypothetical protein PAPYR_8760 [Paratrimastix pyriformis]